MTTLRLLADDLTGALDTAAEFVPLTGPVHAFWAGVMPTALPPSAVLDTGSRELAEAAARETVGRATSALAGATIAFKKIDSLIRGQTLPELAACWRVGAWSHAVLAPAFPFQGRITRSGQQFAWRDDDWEPVGPHLVTALLALGVPARSACPGETLLAGVTVFDAETDAQLEAVVAGASGKSVLWCGTGGLAHALAAGAPRSAMPDLPRPILGLFGSDQAATAAQLAACAPHAHSVPHGGEDVAARLQSALARDGVALASLALPPGLTRAEAARRIDAELSALVATLPHPGTLVVAGGETLRALCLALGATSLRVEGRMVPGVPVSTLCGERWDGVTVVSKSGAFGHPTLWRDLLTLPGTVLERTDP